MKGRPGTSNGRIDRDARIGIVGAGAAGLSAADYLRQAGFGRVVVLERESRVGGKCRTMQHQGRSVDLGAIQVLLEHRRVQQLARRAGERLRRGSPRRISSIDGIGGSHMIELPTSRLRLAWALLRLAREVVLEGRRWGPGYAGATPEAGQLFVRWLGSRQLQHLESLGCYFTTTGSGFIEELPAAYVMKPLNRWRLLDVVAEGLGLHIPSRHLEGGFQALMEHLAQGLDVRLGVQIERIERGQTVEVRTSEGSFELDYLILTSPLDQALAFLDASSEEQRLFGKIRYNPFWSLAAVVRGLPRAALLFPENCTPGRRGHPVYLLPPWKDRDLLISYAYDDPQGGEDHIVDRFRAQVERLGGSVETVEALHRWQYGPHVSPDDFAGGFYDQLEGLQGQRRTFYAGEALVFPGVDYVMGYSHGLVNRFFAKVR